MDILEIRLEFLSSVYAGIYSVAWGILEMLGIYLDRQALPLNGLPTYFSAWNSTRWKWLFCVRWASSLFLFCKFFFFFLQILLLEEILIHSRNFFESIVELAFFLSGAILWGAETLFGEKKTGKSAGNEKNP